MNLRPECEPCLFRQAQEALALGGLNDASQVEVLDRVKEHLAQANWNQPAPALAQTTHRLIRQLWPLGSLVLHHQQPASFSKSVPSAEPHPTTAPGGSSPGARTAMSAQTYAEQLADKAVRAPGNFGAVTPARETGSLSSSPEP
jgi:hypothetical protein